MWGEVLTIIAVNIALIYWIRQDKNDFISRMESWKNEINKEMKDFHGKLERQDAELKAYLMYHHDKK